MKKITGLCVLFYLLVNLTSAQQKPDKKEDSKKSKTSLEQIISQKSSDFIITNENTSKKSGVRHVYLRQAINGIEVYGTESSIHYDKSGTVLLSHNNFIENIQSTLVNKTANLNSRQAVVSVANQMKYNINDLQEIEDSFNKNQKYLYNKAGISSENIPVKLMYYYRQGIGTTIVWELSVAEINSSDWWNFHVDAVTGFILDKYNLTQYCNILGDHDSHDLITEKSDNFIGPLPQEKQNESGSFNLRRGAASYNVYPMPIESPNHGSRSLVANIENVVASPYDWHDIDGIAGGEYTNTRGNNVSAYDDDDANDLPDDRYTESPGGNLIFDFPINIVYSNINQSDDAIVTNLFYWNNIIHDVIYQYGLDAESGSFQENNYGNGGLGGDSVNAQAQDGSGTCNAFFSTPVDGSKPRMRMYVCSSRDGDLDNGVIVHEYGHGISNRLTGGAGNTSCLGNTEQMGEGWSDFYSLLLTMESGDTGTDTRPIGTWLFGETANGPGIRTYPYSTLLATNPHTYDDIKTEAIPHGIGSVWTVMLWEMTWKLIEDQGFDTDFYNGTGGNNIALSLVTEALKLQPCSPGFVDGRDAILAADQALYAGAYQCLIWEAFAKRGLGYSAIQGSSSDRSDGTEAFDLPPNFSSLNTIEEICLSDGLQSGLSGGIPEGGVYSGDGVTDDGNGMTFSFDPNVSGAGLISINYDVDDFCLGTPTTIIDEINVTNDPPEIITRGGGNITFNNSQSDNPGLSIPDNDTDGLTSTFNVTDNQVITDLNVDIDITHTYIGDLNITIKSPSGTTVTIVDRPGVPASTFGCSGDNILATFDDEAVSPIETECAGTTPTINGSIMPENPLSVFDGENTLGIWEINVFDNAGGDIGSLNTWAITYDYEVLSTPLDVVLDATGNATINAEDLLYSSSVTCGVVSVTGGNPLTATVNFTCLDLGVNNVDVTAANDSGTSTSDIAVVNVIDNLNPTAVGQDIIVDLGGTGSVSITANDVDNGSTDNCDFTLSIDVDTFTIAGIYPVILTVTDSSGNENEITVNVEVIDSSLSIESYEYLENQIRIYPVPTKAILNMSTDLIIDSIDMFDLLGKHIMHIENPSNKIDVANISHGMYLLKFQTKSKTVIKRFIKN